jgi:ubiquinone/menaquinone biosynthesis C-methylase UbiE
MPKTTAFDQHTGQYEQWFEKNHHVFHSELEAIKKVLPVKGEGIEIGIGSGIFAVPLGINKGVEPSEKMRPKAIARGLEVVNAPAEALPYDNNSIDYALMVTTICFVDDPVKSLQEAARVLRKGGSLVIGFVDKNSPLGEKYQQHKNHP